MSLLQARKPRKTSWTLKEIVETEFPEPNWLVPDLLPQGFFFIGGKAKLGKSFLAFQMAIAKAIGGEFLGRKLKAGRVLYLAYEDTARRFKKRVCKMQAIATTNLEIEEAWKPLTEGGSEDLVKRLNSKTYTLCIVDPWNRAMRLKDTRDATQTVKAIDPLHQLTRDGIFSFGFVDHHHKTREGSGDPVEDIHGSIAKGSVVDNVWGFYRERGKADAKILIAAKDTEISEVEIRFCRDTLTWVLKDNPMVKPGSNQDKILKYIQAGKEQSFISEIAKSLGMDKSIVSREISELVAKGLVGKPENAKQGKPMPVFLLPEE